MGPHSHELKASSLAQPWHLHPREPPKTIQHFQAKVRESLSWLEDLPPRLPRGKANQMLSGLPMNLYTLQPGQASAFWAEGQLPQQERTAQTQRSVLAAVTWLLNFHTWNFFWCKQGSSRFWTTAKNADLSSKVLLQGAEGAHPALAVLLPRSTQRVCCRAEPWILPQSWHFTFFSRSNSRSWDTHMGDII